MPHAVVGIVLVAHGLITTMIGFGSMSYPSSAAMPTPSWLAWWPGTLGRSWAFDALNLGSGPALFGGLLWLAAGLALVGAGLGWLGLAAHSLLTSDAPRRAGVLDARARGHFVLGSNSGSNRGEHPRTARPRRATAGARIVFAGEPANARERWG